MSKRSQPKWLRRWVVSISQVIETVYGELHNALNLRRERRYFVSRSPSGVCPYVSSTAKRLSESRIRRSMIFSCEP